MKINIFFLVSLLLVACQQTTQKNQPQTIERLSFQEKTVPEKAEQTQPEVKATQSKVVQQEETKDDIVRDDYDKAMGEMENMFHTSAEPESDFSSQEQELIYLDDSDSLRQLEFGYIEHGWIFDQKEKNSYDKNLVTDPLLWAIYKDVDAIVLQVNKMESNNQRIFMTAMTSVSVILRSTVSDEEKQKQAVAAVALILDLAKKVGKNLPNTYGAIPLSGQPDNNLDLLEVQRVVELIAYNELSPITIRMVGD